MWVFFDNKNELKDSMDFVEKSDLFAFFSLHDANKTFMNDIPYCKGISDLAVVKLTMIDGKPIVTTTRNILDFPKKNSTLLDLFVLCYLSQSTDIIGGTWDATLSPALTSVESENISSITYVTIDCGNNENIIFKLLGELHVTNNRIQTFIPRFMITMNSSDFTTLNIFELLYTHNKDMETNICTTNCTYTDPKTKEQRLYIFEHKFNLDLPCKLDS